MDKKKRAPKSQRTWIITNALAVISVRKDSAFDNVITPAPKLNPRFMQPRLAAGDFGLLRAED